MNKLLVFKVLLYQVFLIESFLRLRNKSLHCVILLWNGNENLSVESNFSMSDFRSVAFRKITRNANRQDKKRHNVWYNED